MKGVCKTEVAARFTGKSGGMAKSQPVNTFNVRAKKIPADGTGTHHVNAVEALIGAISLDLGCEKAREFVLEKFSRKKRIVETDYKSRLQEMVQKKFRMPPTYVVLNESGPDHDKIFHVQVRVRKDALGEGKGRSKKEAEQDAAYRAIKVHKNSITSLT